MDLGISGIPYHKMLQVSVAAILAMLLPDYCLHLQLGPSAKVRDPPNLADLWHSQDAIHFLAAKE